MYKVFIVDDESLIARGLEKIIDWESMGLIPYVYTRSVNAYESALIEKPQIIVTDIKMPFMDGLELIARLRKTGLLFEAIILSGHSEFEYARKGINLGVNKYLLKPIAEEELKKALKYSIIKYEDALILDDEEVSKLRGAAAKTYVYEEGFHSHDVIENITEYICSHYTEDITLSLLSERFFLNPSYISQLFKDKKGISYIYFLTSIRIEKAKELLGKGDKNVHEVCHSVGYKNVKHFSRTFEKLVGMKPGLYKRKSNR